MTKKTTRRELELFSQAISERLKTLQPHAEWKTANVDFLLVRLIQEVGNFGTALENGPKEKVLQSAADAAAYLMMITDIVGSYLEGARVFVAKDMDSDVVYSYGYGTYLGEEVPPASVTVDGKPLEKPNPKIRLDSGEVIWGCQCFWVAAEAKDDAVGTRKLVEVLPDARGIPVLPEEDAEIN
jgi:hypothetical protein